ncbi:MAG: 1-acyl-sn-glycerol-3-phosphate acyltransferase [Anaerolineales bacterium]|nr:1-acyl-sn-glycerol-3-phosphate acyltransferase [Anaerolineales bacterium]
MKSSCLQIERYAQAIAKSSASSPTMRNLLYWAAKPLADVGSWALFDLDIEYHAALPAGPKIIASNHPSTTDPFLMAKLAAEPLSLVIEERLFKVPVLGRYLENAGHIRVIDGNGRLAYEEARQTLLDGGVVGIYPEGSISPLEGGLHPPRSGTARLALETGAPIIPVGIHLDRERLKLIETKIEDEIAVGTWYLSGPYAMTVGRPLVFKGSVENRDWVQNAAEQIMERIAGLIEASEERVLNKRLRLFSPNPSRSGLLPF